MKFKSIVFALVTLCVAFGGLPVTQGQTAVPAKSVGTLKTPETSRHFIKYVDSKSQVVSWRLKAGEVAMNQQTFYFVNPSMSNDGRYFWFYCMFTMTDSKSLAVIDFLTDEIYHFPKTRGCGFSAMVDYETGNVWYVNKSEGLLCQSPDPTQKARLVAGVPKNFPKGYLYQIACHLTWDPTHSKFFLDSRVDNKFFCGTLDIKTGKYTKWADMDFMFNHAQFNPVRGEPVFLCKEFYVDSVTKEKIRIPTGKDGVYERLWLLTSKDGFKRLTPYKNKYATHEWWSASGDNLYYCCGFGVARYNLDTEKQDIVFPGKTTHAHSSSDDKYFVCDRSEGPWYRGCAWSVHFYNTVSKKEIPIVTLIPAYNAKENESKIHPDPHPQFVGSDRYIAATVNIDGKTTVQLTPVKELIEKSK
ncbi:MAG: hypothetical protein PHQ75_07275 [Thermoguttaceae bacterium]|nr:hypothetical protein [Thermoguttaceae bacterium]